MRKNNSGSCFCPFVVGLRVEGQKAEPDDFFDYFCGSWWECNVIGAVGDKNGESLAFSLLLVFSNVCFKGLYKIHLSASLSLKIVHCRINQ